MAVLEVTQEGLVLKELAPGVSLEEALRCTDAELIIPDNVVTTEL